MCHQHLPPSTPKLIVSYRTSKLYYLALLIIAFYVNTSPNMCARTSLCDPTTNIDLIGSLANSFPLIYSLLQQRLPRCLDNKLYVRERYSITSNQAKTICHYNETEVNKMEGRLEDGISLEENSPQKFNFL